MEILDLYKSVLDAAGMVTDEQGFVSVNSKLFSDTAANHPAQIDGKRLVLPTLYQLKSPDKEKIVFHPLSENIMRGESEVITKLRRVLTIKLNYTLVAVVSGMLDIIASIDMHKHLNPDQTEILSVADTVDENTAVAFTSMSAKCIEGVGNNTFISLYLKRSGVINEHKFSRAGIVTFPFFEELMKEQDTYYGVKLRKKDRIAIINIFKHILPKIEVPNQYSRGSDSDIAPYMDALMKTFLAVAGKLNDCIELFKDKVDGLDKLLINSDWVDSFENLGVMISQIRKIPMQAGNEGATKSSEAPAVSNGTVAPAPLQYVPPAPAMIPQLQHQQPAIGTVAYHAPAPVQYQPPAPVAPVVPGIVKTARGGIDMTAMQNMNPHGQMQQPYMQPHIPASMMQQDPRMMQQMQQQRYHNPNGPRSQTFNHQMQPQVFGHQMQQPFNQMNNQQYGSSLV